MASVRGEFCAPAARRLFCLLAEPAAPTLPQRRVLVAPPLFEEQNKCRRLLALVQRELASSHRCASVQPDYAGTGDSGLDLPLVAWTDWVDDWQAMASGLDAGPAGTARSFLALRAGALVLAAAMAGQSAPFAGARIVLAQPVLDGARFLQQFLRLRVVATKMAGGNESIADLEAEIARAGSVEVAGYTLPRALTDGLAACRVTADVLKCAAEVRILEFKADGGTVSAPAAALCTELVAAGVSASATCVAAEQFWTTQEISAPVAAVTALCEAVA